MLQASLTPLTDSSPQEGLQSAIDADPSEPTPLPGGGSVGLPIEVALAMRVSRNASIRPILKWIREPTDTVRPTDYLDTVAAIIEEAIPVQGPSSDGPLKKNASIWLAKSASYIDERTAMPEGTRRTLVLACLLPLLRSDGETPFKTCYAQVRERIGEALSMLSVIEMLGDDFAERARNLSDMGSPWEQIAEILQINTAALSEIAKDCVSKLPADTNYTAENRQWISELAIGRFENTPPDWATPQQLWQLAGEVRSAKQNMLLPREWVNASLRWEEVEHWWRRLDAALSQQNSQSPKTNGGLAGVSDLSARSRLESAADSNATLAPNARPQASRDSTTSAQLELQKSDASQPAKKRLPIAQVMSHNDPVFVGALQRMIASVRSSQGCLSLATIVIHPSDRQGNQAVAAKQEDGLVHWQDQLIVALNNSSDIDKVLCFVTKDGEFLVALPNLERDEATEALRREIVGTIHASVRASAQTLNEGALPAKYYAGIGSVVRPSTTFDVQKLIEAAQRCFTAAKRQGPTAIKSIEVY